MDSQAQVAHKEDTTYLAGIDFRGWGAGEMCEFASALAAMLRCVGDDVPYHTLLGATGVAFRFTFGPELWNPGFYSFSGVTADVDDLIRRAFGATGYGYRQYPKGDRQEDFRRIADSIDQGIGVMLRGNVIDASDWVLVGGYDPDGSELFGASPYGARQKLLPGLDPMPNWYDKTEEYILLGQKQSPTTPSVLYVESLRLASRLARPSGNAPHYTGLGAYDTLVAVLREAEFPEQAERQEDTPWFRYLCLLCYNMMLDDHKSAPPFLRSAAATLPVASTQLLAAAEHYEQSGNLRDQLDSVLPSDFSQQSQQRVLDPAIREAFAQILLKIRDTEDAGVSLIEHAAELVG